MPDITKPFPLAPIGFWFQALRSPAVAVIIAVILTTLSMLGILSTIGLIGTISLFSTIRITGILIIDIITETLNPKP